MARQSRPVTVLLTRPVTQGARFAADLAGRFGGGIRVVQTPLITPRFLQPPLPTGARSVIFTSETGVLAFRQLSPRPQDVPDRAWCVGDRTADAARAAGFSVMAGDGGSDVLFSMIVAARPAGPLLHLRGREARGDLANRLTAAGLQTFEAIVYAQQEQPLTQPARLALISGQPVIVPLFSPRTALLFAAEVPKDASGPVHIAALSPAVATGLGGFPAASVSVAAKPTSEAMVCAIDMILRGLEAT